MFETASALHDCVRRIAQAVAYGLMLDANYLSLVVETKLNSCFFKNAITKKRYVISFILRTTVTLLKLLLACKYHCRHCEVLPTQHAATNSRMYLSACRSRSTVYSCPDLELQGSPGLEFDVAIHAYAVVLRVLLGAMQYMSYYMTTSTQSSQSPRCSSTDPL